MRVKSLSLIICFLLNSAVGLAQIRGKKLFFIRDASGHQWCGYTSESQAKAEAHRLHARVEGEVDYMNDRVSAIVSLQSAESGDWEVEDRYTLDKSEKLQTLTREISTLIENVKEEQRFLIQNGKAIKQSTTTRDLDTGAPAKSLPGGDYKPIVTNLQSFPFWPLIRDRRQEVWSKGKACVDDKR